MTAGLPTLANQVELTVRLIADSLYEAGTGWDRVIYVSFYLYHTESLDRLRETFRQLVRTEIPQVMYVPVAGYSAEGKLIEIEVTAFVGQIANLPPEWTS